MKLRQDDLRIFLITFSNISFSSNKRNSILNDSRSKLNSTVSFYSFWYLSHRFWKAILLRLKKTLTAFPQDFQKSIVFWVADFFALMNDKMGGDIEKIKTTGNYLVEVWKSAGMHMDRVKFIWASEEICKRADEYARQVLDIARRFTVASPRDSATKLTS